MKYPITYFFSPEKLKKGDMLIINETDFIYVADTIYLKDPLRPYETFCQPFCGLENLDTPCTVFIRQCIPERERHNYIYKTCPGMFFDDYNVAWMHIYKLCIGGI